MTIMRMVMRMVSSVSYSPRGHSRGSVGLPYIQVPRLDSAQRPREVRAGGEIGREIGRGRVRSVGLAFESSAARPMYSMEAWHSGQVGGRLWAQSTRQL